MDRWTKTGRRRLRPDRRARRRGILDPASWPDQGRRILPAQRCVGA